MLKKTSELTGAVLDWAVAYAMGQPVYISKMRGRLLSADYGSFETRKGAPWWSPSNSWRQGGPIIERWGIEICRLENGEWRAQVNEKGCLSYCRQYGPTPLIAAMRCHVEAKWNHEIEVPEAICNH